jgi:hypothetical protein
MIGMPALRYAGSNSTEFSMGSPYSVPTDDGSGALSPITGPVIEPIVVMKFTPASSMIWMRLPTAKPTVDSTVIELDRAGEGAATEVPVMTN